MARYNEKRIAYVTQDKLLGILSQTFSKLGKSKAIHDFLKDLLNRQERAMLTRRLLIAQFLVDGVTYSDIQKKLKCGASTIAKVERWLNFGRGGYRTALYKRNKN
ncbi:TPA: hypothetical protein DIC39_02560 [Patescibacteria group bacterium]|nr:MAG: TrpR like protein, YerC/YecD [Parcubacteria group bacterium GW2011_GWA2_46_39]HBV33237.1 hypothetical protein [Patescibacteria group bacterium]HCU47915.1 hypothetical protein [Patescibacteria group bacterium]